VQAQKHGGGIVVKRQEGRSDDGIKSLLEAMLHRLELIRQHSEQQVAALRGLYIEIGGLRADIAKLLLVQSKEK
jgi:hypothetical protein